MTISLYADAMETAAAARAKRMGSNENEFDLVGTKTGEVILSNSK